MNPITVRLEGERPAEHPVGTVVGSLAPARRPADLPYIAALVNNDVCSLSYPLTVNSTVRFLRSFSTTTTGDAPREAASIPTTPEPAKRSRNEVPDKSPRMANIDSRILSIAGRMTPGGQLIRLPR